MNLKKVVVTGIGALTPIGKNVNEYWHGLSNGVSGAADITRFDTTHFRTKFACEVKDYDPFNHFDRKEARKMDYFTQFALIAANEAVENSGLEMDSINLDRAGIVWAAGIGGLKTITAKKLMEKRPEDLVRFSVKGMLPKNKLGAELFRNLSVVAGTEHKYEAQKPKKIKKNFLDVHRAGRRPARTLKIRRRFPGFFVSDLWTPLPPPARSAGKL